MKPTILALILMLTPAATAATAGLPSFNGLQEPSSGFVVCPDGIAYAGSCPSNLAATPGPGGALGVVAGWRLSRQLRRRIREGRGG